MLTDIDSTVSMFNLNATYHVLFLKRCMTDAVEKGQSSNGVGKSLFAVYLENTLFKDKFIHPFLELETCEHIDASVRSKRTIFDKVRETSILLFVKFFTAFVNVSPKGGTIRIRGGHVV